ncbi:hypothetical protein ABS71_09705 [bacterium SCN 62-11]|nr:hypothetical protein [Candidatus Eremiobacteraeota bacterium]ODT68476.1 MAG: hypothetical protein ABS71_09705 [bacterium SCN 62-11]
MRKTLIALIALSGLAGAKPVSDTQKTFSVNAPDSWKFSSGSDSRGVAQAGWKNEKNTGAMMITAVPVKEKSLEDWAKGAARQSPKTTISDEKLGGQAAKRLEFTTDEGYTNVLWLTRKGKNGAMVSLVYTSECKDDIPAIRKSIVSSFHWNR